MDEQAVPGVDARPSVTVLGLGILGSAIARRLMSQGFTLSLWARNRQKVEDLEAAGAQLKESPAAAVGAADVTLLLLPDFSAVCQVLSPPDVGRALKGKVVLQMGTLSPAESGQVAAMAAAAGADYLEAPVQGSQGEAERGELQVMLGAALPPSPRAPASAVLAALSSQQEYVGPVGSAAALKLAMNQLLAAETAAFSQSLALVRHHGIEVELFMRTLRGSALYAPQYDKKLAKMLEGRYGEANFSARHLLKDVRLFTAAARAAQQHLEVLQEQHGGQGTVNRSTRVKMRVGHCGGRLDVIPCEGF